MRNVLVVMSRLDSEKLSSVQFSKSLGLSLGVIYSMPERVPEDCRGLSLCRLSFIKQSNTKPLYSFLEEMFRPDLVIVFDCYEKQILKGLYGVGCPVIKIVEGAGDYCMRGDYRYRSQFSCELPTTFKCLSSCWAFTCSKRSYVHQRELIQYWKQSHVIVTDSEDHRMALLANDVSEDVIQLSSVPLLETLTHIVSDLGYTRIL